MQALLQGDTPKVTFPLPVDPALDPLLTSNALQHIGERLRLSYDVVKEPAC
jgi:hypothetical protein